MVTKRLEPRRVTQQSECFPYKEEVVGANPTVPIIWSRSSGVERLVDIEKAAGAKPAVTILMNAWMGVHLMEIEVVGSNPTCSTRGAVAQWIERVKPLAVLVIRNIGV